MKQQQQKGKGLTTYFAIYELDGSAIEMHYQGSFREALQETYLEVGTLYSSGAIVEIKGLKIIHQATDQVLIDWTIEDLQGIGQAFDVNKFSVLGKNRVYNITLALGSADYKEQLILIFRQLADIYLDQFNIPDSDFPTPAGYLNANDARRDLQYLTEYLKIAQFQLAGINTLKW